MKKTIFILFISVFTLFQNNLKAQAWIPLGESNDFYSGGTNCICVDLSGNVYAAGTFENSSGNCYVAKFDGNNWTELGGLNGLAPNTYIYSICSDPSGNIYAAGAFFNSSGNCFVAKFNGTSWSELGGPNALGASYWIKSVISDTSGNIYAAGLFWNLHGNAYVAKYNGTSWSELGGSNSLAAVECTCDTGLGSGNSIYSLCTDQSGNVYAAGNFVDSPGRSFVAKYNGVAWSDLGGLYSLSANSTINTITSDKSGNIYAAGNFTNDSSERYVAKYDGTFWSELGGFNSLGARSFGILSICTDPMGNVYAAGAFTDSLQNAYVAKYNGTNWNKLGNSDSLFITAEISSICSDHLGNIYTDGSFKGVNTEVAEYEYGIANGINAVSSSNSINLYPNPTNSVINISLGSAVHDASIKVISTTGQIISEENNQSGTAFTIDMSGQASGIYYVEINSVDGTSRQKFVKM